ncbi:formylglycine-generating enzyme family protein [Hippea maritima]|uniref:Sulphatase-modifying factor protein n=1 Tax=Hippea maritima (strain ATCC 700847 / DSM 10411 / MH2) TaxID=760142 RepID=F2LUM2_HIPMA|nr:formylglycine-generating enzyme family protein [Hippea maritima]AEA34612.1 Sulphatase-modifying factor protein [Hippea maritima DSM 10411]
MIKKLVFVFVFLFISINAFAFSYQNPQVKRDGNYVVFYYDLLGKPNQEAVVGIRIRVKNKIYVTRNLHLQGDIGLVQPGLNKRIYWDIFKDFPNGLPKDSKWSLMVRPTHYTNPLGMKFVYIPGGCFQMGANPQDKWAQNEEKPLHKVCLSGFFIGQYEVTNKQYNMFDPKHDSGGGKLYDLSKPSQPVVNVSWDEIQKFIKWLYIKTGEVYRLPTEAEWEYAARGGLKKDTYWDNPKNACKYANVYDETAFEKLKRYKTSKTHFPCKDGYVGTAPVGRFLPNSFGLYDMIGNAAEWCYDTYYAKAYQYMKNAKNPVYLNPYISLAKVVRGGNWLTAYRYNRLSARSNYMPGLRDDFIGFRLVLEP